MATFETGNGNVLNKKLKLIVMHFYKIKSKTWMLRGNSEQTVWIFRN